MLAGPNFEQLELMQHATQIPVVCSGGVTTITDIERLLELNTHAAILGRALYENRLDLESRVGIVSANCHVVGCDAIDGLRRGPAKQPSKILVDITKLVFLRRCTC
jgi:hypothetical protein